MTDERPCVYVHAEVPSSDDVRTFYEIPSVVADHIRAVDPDKPFVECLVQVFEAIDELRGINGAFFAVLRAHGLAAEDDN